MNGDHRFCFLMREHPVDPEIRAAATDHLLKALLATLTVREPDLVDRVRDMFLIATAYDSRVATEHEAVWQEISSELQAVEDLVRGTAGPETEDGPLEDDGADSFLKTGT